MGVSFLTTLYIARVLGPTNFGELDYAFAVIGVFAPLASLGIGNVLQRELIKHPEEDNLIMGTALRLNFILAIGTVFVVSIVAFTSSSGYLSSLLILILSLTFILGVFQLLQQEFYARAESKIPSIITMIVWVIISIGKVGVLVSGKGVLWLASISVLEQALYAMLLLVAYKKYGRRSMKTWKYSSRYTPVILKTGFATALASFFTLIYARIDQIFIRHMIDAYAVGLYSSGVRLVDMWNIVPGMLTGGLYPAILNARHASPALYRIRMFRLFMVLLISGIILAGLTSFFAPFLMEHIFGHEFIAGTASLRIYAWSIVGTFLGIYVMNILFTEDNRSMLIITNVVPAVINIALNLWLIPYYGIVGAAWATVIAYTITPLVPFCFKASRTHLQNIFTSHHHA